MGHGRAGGRLPETLELPKGRHVVIKHNGNVGLYNRELAGAVISETELGKLKEKQTLTIYLEGDELYYRPKGSQKQGAPLSYGLA